MKILNWHIPISGFTQSIDRANGFDKLWLNLRPLVNEETSLLPPQRWNANFSGIAEFIHRMRPEKQLPDIRVYAYSWGCGHGFQRLSKELWKRGLVIRKAVLCDPVYHSWWRPWRSMIFSPNITIRKNVNHVDWFFQRQNKPQGTTLVAATSWTTITAGVELNYNHAYMEDAPEFHAKCLEVAKNET